MNTVSVQPLTAEAFQPFGSFANVLNPGAERFGKPPVEFYRDIIQQDVGAETASFSICRVEARPLVIAAAEYHNRCCEGILPIDNDVLIHVGPATPPSAPLPVDRLKVFRVPRGTLVVLRPGVWHLAPYTTNDEPANVLVVLPERTYANDCVVSRLDESQHLEIVGV
jgi:ureidoglycolate lyase